MEITQTSEDCHIKETLKERGSCETAEAANPDARGYGQLLWLLHGAEAKRSARAGRAAAKKIE